MTTYGKRNRSVKPSFTVFQDVVDNEHNDGQSTLYEIGLTIWLTKDIELKLPCEDVLPSAKPHNLPSNDESTDELGEVSPRPLLSPSNADAQRNGNTVKIELRKPISNTSIQESIDKPLPPIPLQIKGDAKVVVRRPLQALRSKTPNLKLLKTETKYLARPKQTAIDSEDWDFGTQDTSIRNQDTNKAKITKLNSFDTENVGNKITGFLRSATFSDQRTSGRKGAHKLDDEPRPSPLKRGKEVISKATRTIADRLNSGKPAMSPAEISERIVQIYEEQPSARELTSDQRHPYMRIPRKPLPVYESMRSRRESLDEVLGPIDSKLDLRIETNSPAEVKPPTIGLDISFDRRKPKAAASKTSLREPFFDSQTSSPTDFAAPRHQRRRTFSNAVSGLAQHPNADIFASSPVDHSTPRIRLDPAPAEGDRGPSRELHRSPSILEFSFELSESDEASSPSKPLTLAAAAAAAAADISEDELSPDADPKNGTKNNQSIKRRSSEVDLRSRLHPDNKQKRLKPLFGKDTNALASHLRTLATKDDINTNNAARRDVLGEKDPNAKITARRPNTADANPSSTTGGKGKGLDIFQVPKSKATLATNRPQATIPARTSSATSQTSLLPSSNGAAAAAATAANKRPRNRPPGASGKNSHSARAPGRQRTAPGFPRRPTSILFSRESRESRAAVKARREWEKVREGNRCEEMEVDELGM